MEITLEEYKKELVRHIVEEGRLIPLEAKELGISTEAFAEAYLETSNWNIKSLINERYKMGLIVGTVYLLEEILDDEDVEEVKRRLNLDSPASETADK